MRLLDRAKLLGKRNPWVFRLLSLATRDNAHLTARDTDLCLEGAPSSGNTFALVAVRAMLPGLRISHHSHAVANVRLALHYNVPVVILIRAPEDAAASRMARFHVTAERCLAEYVEFYSFVMSRPDLHIFTFDSLVSNPGKMIALVARLTGRPLPSIDEARLRDDALREIDQYSGKKHRQHRASRPNAAREGAKDRLRAAIVADPNLPAARELWDALRQRGARQPA